MYKVCAAWYPIVLVGQLRRDAPREFLLHGDDSQAPAPSLARISSRSPTTTIPRELQFAKSARLAPPSARSPRVATSTRLPRLNSPFLIAVRKSGLLTPDDLIGAIAAAGIDPMT